MFYIDEIFNDKGNLYAIFGVDENNDETLLEFQLTKAKVPKQRKGYQILVMREYTKNDIATPKIDLLYILKDSTSLVEARERIEWEYKPICMVFRPPLIAIKNAPKKKTPPTKNQKK